MGNSTPMWQQQVHAARAEARGHVRPEDVVLHRIAPEEWRVLNGALASGDVDALLGFVCRVGTRYELTLLEEPMRHSSHESLEAVLGIVADGGGIRS